ncbi:MAG: hypothetical protein IKP97_04775 [Kiritimatiellae bacterium]|nr:hypothetical protein [Kiritimatiellia bacterium]
MKRILAILVIGISGAAWAGRMPGFNMEAFNAGVPAETLESKVFSPLGFELDSVMMANAFEPIAKSHFAETLGVLTGLEGTYVPILRHLREVSSTNRLSYVSARAFLVPDFRKVSAAYAQDLQRDFQGEVTLAFPKEGAECWFRAMMEGDMEDFEIPMDTAKSERNSFYELASVHISWAEPFPVGNRRKKAFLPNEADFKTRVLTDMMCDIREVELYTGKTYTMGRLPMADGAWFYAVLPHSGTSLKAVREQLTEKNFGDLLVMMDSITETGIYKGPAVVAIPTMDQTSVNDLTGAMGHFKFPVQGYLKLNGDIPGRDFRQVVRFRLDEQGVDAEPLKDKPQEQQVHLDKGKEIHSLVLNRPFLYFIYHEPTKSVIVMGQYTGR